MRTIHVVPDACIACTACTVFCPVAEATGDFLGPRMIGPAYERFRRSGLEEDPSLSYCANCKNCDISCPQGVPVSSINMAARARQCELSHPHWLRDWIVAHNETLGRLLAPVPALLKNGSLKNPLVRMVLDKVGIDRRAGMPRYAKRPFRSLLKRLDQPKTGRKVALFPGCYVELFDPQAGLDLVWALNRAGWEVLSPSEFVCCGVPMLANGFARDAGQNADRNLAAMRSLAERGIPILTGCPSCELMFREELPLFFPEKFEGKRPLVRDAQEFLLDEARSRGFRIDFPRGKRVKVLYHAPCHLRALGIGLPGLELLRDFGVEAVPANAGCCGISGSYGFKKEKYEISRKVGSALFDAVKESGAPLVATECGTCRLQIEGATSVPAVHPVSVLRSLAE